METLTYKCPNCSGGLLFDPEKQQYQCEYCRSEFAEIPQAEQMHQVKLESESPPKDNIDAEFVYYQCPSCGAELVTDETTVASFCFYCHNPVVLAGKLGGEFWPDQIIPFAVDREKVLSIFREWLGKQKYLPSDFYSEQQIEKLTGVYFPYWFYESKIDGFIQARCEQRRTWTTGQTEYTEIKSFDVVREGVMEVQNVPRNALKKADSSLIDAVFPFDISKLTDFSMPYLTGFFAEKRDRGQEEFSGEVKQEVRSFAEDQLRSSIAYASVSIQNSRMNILGEGWKYVLLPVWTLTYQSKRDGKVYYFACNGENGRVCGKLPVDHKKLAGLFAAIFLPLFLVLLIAGYLI